MSTTLNKVLTQSVNNICPVAIETRYVAGIRAAGGKQSAESCNLNPYDGRIAGPLHKATAIGEDGI